MRIAYFTPLNPQKSGISDFAEELLPCMKQLNNDIDLFVANIKPSNPEITGNFKIYDIASYDREEIRKNYDVTVYQIGNNYECHHEISKAFFKYGGIVELHDVSLHHYLAEATLNQKQPQKYVEIMSYCHGKNGKQVAERFLAGEIPSPWVTNSMTYTVNRQFVDQAKAIIVHSDLAKQMVKAINPVRKSIFIPLHTPDIVADCNKFRSECRDKFSLPPETYVFGSFGNASSEKRILQILDALAQYKKVYNKNFHYYVVGKENGIHIDEKARQLGLQNEVTLTGYTDLSNFKAYMGACDICFNLRYPTQGESSASLHRMLGFGKPVIVTKIGAFEEYPNDIVVKVRYDEHETDDILDALCQLTRNRQELTQRGQNAWQFAKDNCDVKKNARKYLDFFQNLIKGNYQDNYTDFFLDRLFLSGLTDDSYVHHLLRDKKLKNLL